MSVRVGTAPLSVAQAYAALEDPSSGGAALFLGRVRSERVAAGEVRALLYEAHRPLAEKSLRALEASARKRWGVRRVVLWHRTGLLRIGTISVIVGTAAPHRESAFAAARWLISTLKVRSPIWKTDRVRSVRRPRRPPRHPAGRGAG